jgi:hypothetical protein
MHVEDALAQQLGVREGLVQNRQRLLEPMHAVAVVAVDADAVGHVSGRALALRNDMHVVPEAHECARQRLALARDTFDGIGRIVA